MWPFKQKRLFQITWAYDAPSKYHFTEIIKAADLAGAWKKIRNQHGISISLIKWEELIDA